MKKTVLLMGLCSLLFAAEGRYEVTPTISGVFPEGNTDLKSELSVGLRVAKYFDDAFINKYEIGAETTRAHYKDLGPGTGNRQAIISRFFIHGIKEFEISDKAYFYALAGLGYENIRKKARYGNNDSPYGNYGLGFKYDIAEDLSLRAELRHAIKLHSGHGDNNLFATLGVAYAIGKKPSKVVISTEVETPIYDTPIQAEPTEKVDDEPTETAAVEPEVVQELDSDNDGVVDSADLCPNTPTSSKVDEVGCVKAITLHVNFTSGKSDILVNYMPQIVSVAEILKNETNYRVILEGHTDSTGSEKFNLKLSEERVKAVAGQLIRLGVDSNRITTESYGETKPLVANDTAEGRAKNRRVEANFIK